MLSAEVLILFVRLALLVHGKRIVLFSLRILVCSFELCGSNIAFLLFEKLSASSIGKHNRVLLGIDVVFVLSLLEVVIFSLLILSTLLSKPHHFLVVVVLIAASLDLVCEFRVLLSNLDLLLKPCFLVFQFPQSILHHLSLDNYIGQGFLIIAPTSICFYFKNKRY